MFQWPTDLQQLPEAIWRRLSNACGNIADPLRLPALATVSTTTPAIRTVVLRNTNALQRTLTFFSDSRAPKITELVANPNCAFLFYDPQQQIQIRANGATSIHQLNAISDFAWNQLPESKQAEYTAALAPGTPITSPDAPSTDSSNRAHFAVITAVIHRIEWLQLSSPFHRRAHFTFQNSQWRGHWIAP